jgi:hypothetical protein
MESYLQIGIVVAATVGLVIGFIILFCRGTECKCCCINKHIDVDVEVANSENESNDDALDVEASNIKGDTNDL